MQVQIPGGTAELRDKPTVGGRDLLQETGFDLLGALQAKLPEHQTARFSDLNRMKPGEMGRDLVAAASRLNRAGVVALLKSWTLPAPLPTLDTIPDMELDLYDALMVEVAPRILPAMFGEDFTAARAKDPASPTVPSSGSEPGERATAMSVPSAPPTGEQSDSSANTATGVPSAA